MVFNSEGDTLLESGSNDGLLEYPAPRHLVNGTSASYDTRGSLDIVDIMRTLWQAESSKCIASDGENIKILCGKEHG